MARLTEAAMDRWDRDLAKAAGIVAKVNQEQRKHYATAKGGRLSYLTVALNASAYAGSTIGKARGAVTDLAASEQRRKPVVSA